MASVSKITNSRRDTALEFLLGRIDYERMPVLPYGQRQLKLDRMRQDTIDLHTTAGSPAARRAN